jgi:hypothetical protein
MTFDFVLDVVKGVLAVSIVVSSFACLVMFLYMLWTGDLPSNDK